MDGEARDKAFLLVSGFRATQMVRVVTELGVPDLLAGGPRSADELATSSGVSPDLLLRLLRALVALGVFVETSDGHFSSTPISEQFRDRPGSLRGMALALPDESYSAFAELMHTLKTGEPAFDFLFGMSRWEHLAKNPDKAALFNTFMQFGTEAVMAAVVSAYDFGGASSVVDVGGGRGTLLAAILKANQKLRGTLFDLEAGLAGADVYLEEQGVRNRSKIAIGSFFDGVPSGHDVYVLKYIVHDWNDDKATAILTVCRRAMKDGAKLLLVERMLPRRAEDAPSHRQTYLADIQMMVLLGGRERTEEEFRALLERAHLRLTRVIPTDSPALHIVESVPV